MAVLIFYAYLSMDYNIYREQQKEPQMAFTSKDSLFEITPWQEQPNTLPSRLLQTHTLAKQSFLGRAQPQLQVSNHSIYVIQNHQGSSSPARNDKIAKETLRSSHLPLNPTLHHQLKITQKEENSIDNRSKSINTHQHISNSHKVAEKGAVMSSVRSTSRLRKGRPSQKDPPPVFAHTQKIVFDLKNPKMQGKVTTSQERSAFTTNLLKIYERSTLASDLRRQSTLKEEPIDRICQRRKLKTQKQPFQNPALKTEEGGREHRLRQRGSQVQPFRTDSSQGRLFPRGKMENWSRGGDSGDFEKGEKKDKLQFQLLMERKLFMLKTQASQWLPKGPSARILCSPKKTPNFS